MRFNPYILGSSNLIPPNPYYPVGPDCVLYHAYWDGTAVDHSAAGNNGTLIGSVLPSFGLTGLTFDGVTAHDQAVTLGNPVSLQVFSTNVYTFEAWINPTGADLLPTLFGQSNTISSFDVEIFASGTTNGFAILRPGVDRYYSKDNVISDGTWVHLAITNSGPTGHPIMYVNAVDQTLTSTVYVISAEGNKDIGRRATQYWNFKGIIGEIRIYNDELSAGQLLVNFNATKGRYLA